jgi:uncharacterized membrane protein
MSSTILQTLDEGLAARSLRPCRRLHDTEEKWLSDLRDVRRDKRGATGLPVAGHLPTLGQTIADRVAAAMGSWRFIILQSLMLTVWIALNVTAFVQKWDPYPFILLNLALSFQAAYAAPFIMMAQNRQQDIDRRQAHADYEVNLKAELEIELLHQKLDEFRETEVLCLTAAIRELAELLRNAETPGSRRRAPTPSPP